MQAQEFERKVGIFKRMYGIAVTIAPENTDALIQEMRLLKEVVMGWKAKRGDKCEIAIMTVVGSSQVHDEARELLNQIYKDEQDLSPVLRAMKVEIALLGIDGNPVFEYVLGTAT